MLPLKVEDELTAADESLKGLKPAAAAARPNTVTFSSQLVRLHNSRESLYSSSESPKLMEHHLSEQ